MNETTMNEDGLRAQMDEYLAMLEVEFFDNIGAGMKKSHAQSRAKQTCREAYPEIGRLMDAAMRFGNDADTVLGRSLAASMSGFWKQLYSELEQRKGAVAPALSFPAITASENGQTVEKAAGDVSAASLVRALFTRWCKRGERKVGDVFIFSPYQVADALAIIAGKQVTPNSFANEFLTSQRASSQIQKAGWKFETAGNYERYEVKIVAMPAPAPRTYTAEEVDRIVADAAARAAADALKQFRGGA